MGRPVGALAFWAARGMEAADVKVHGREHGLMGYDVKADAAALQGQPGPLPLACP